MVSIAIGLAAVLLLGCTEAGPESSQVFLNRQEALAVISRHKRANQNNEENQMPPNLERECVEEVCQYEEAREVFQDTYRTDIFWSVYIDGDQCASKPCKNGALCSDSVGGYDCVCKSGFTGTHCETDQTICIPNAAKGCSQFCKPGYVAYECSCADGWRLQEKEKCVPAVPFPCGKVDNVKQWNERKPGNMQEYEGAACSSGECPWMVRLQNAEGAAFCGGVIVKKNLVLTTARCAVSSPGFQVVAGKRSSNYETGEQVLSVKNIHYHPLYQEGKDNDLAVVELRDNITFKKSVTAACLPERDFAESVLMEGRHAAIITGWRKGSDPPTLEGSLTLNYLNYEPLARCAERHSGKVTNKMFCTAPRAKADCAFGEGSPALTLYRDVFFLTGITSPPPGHDCSQGYVFQKVSRFLPWLKHVMDSH
uniref:Protein Z, vitamin K-dependent plasma glycoprotein a n=1 Tax=Paramormyrops kingsleyae TaxID=1676925 RepID=A0A3B3RQV5_9TELE|nr:coagulation factor X-like isoform X1 [Paramormyrops kingsleyae]XP_023666467.1 coagulation factor X-like isoform X1 [Paramormyrops kingsleyae]